MTTRRLTGTVALVTGASSGIGAATELTTHMRKEVQAGFARRFEGLAILEADDIAESITFVVTRPPRMAVNEILIRPTEQQG